MYEYNFLSQLWKQISPTGTIPSIRSCPSWTIGEDTKCYIVGGYDGINRMNDFFELDMNSLQWSEVTVDSGMPPSPRYFHSSHVNISVSSVYTFGGYNVN